MSRFGRNYLQVGMYTELTFPQYGVRFIAIYDNVDSENAMSAENDFTPIKNLFNEWFCRDTSKKIRMVKRSNAFAGKCAGRPPYGYRAVNGNNQEWEIDEYAAGIVREMFRRVIEGDGPHTIGRDLDRRGVDSPMVHYRKHKGIEMGDIDTTWFTFMISRTLENRAYIGQLVSQKYTTPSYKNHKSIIRPEDEWVIIENHHEPIIDLETFETVQRLRANRRRQIKSTGECTALSGLMFCSDCNSKLSIACNTAKYQYFVCSLHRNSNKHYRKDCTRHGIRRDVAERLVLDEIRKTVNYALSDKATFTERVRKLSQREGEKALKHKTTELSKADRRIAELDRIIKRIYEDHVAGKLSDERFSKMLSDYEAEQSELVTGNAELRAEVDAIRARAANVQSFMRLAERFTDVPELTAEIARTFIEKVVVHEPTYFENSNRKGRQSRAQEIDIYFNFIGKIAE
jgi:hypothetical protein